MSTSRVSDHVLETVLPDGAGSRLLRSLKAEFLKIRSTRGTQWVLGILFVSWALAGVALGAISLLGETPEINATVVMAGMVTLVGVLAPIVGILVMAGDWSTRDVVTVFTLEPRRDVVFFAKVIAAIAIGFALAGAAVALGLGLSIALALITGSPLTWEIEGASPMSLIVPVLVAVVSGVAYGAAVPRPAIAITFALLQGTLIDSLLAFAPNGTGTWFQLAAVSDAFTGNGPPGPALTAVLLWLVLPFLYGFVRNRRADIS